ncbi:MAG: hypothetical protein UT08_C0018G0023 [Candidatus Woesebacteria bacterium GW2011_GWB1_38_8]|uniref:Uncharacterized protein n=1 Tax=Candidatus Woesebacteria bacterium GW2011_GWB1_38_8 TaxID=1618570 RepID=A0A0G0L084_9BACT|nr:MAG: hypothetical protein UT08_C0018G0023 [Candidatus Woesebacteria bacterium GW2011_GWB1_38_8]
MFLRDSGKISLLIKALILLDLFIAIVQMSVFILYFTFPDSSIVQLASRYTGPFESGGAFVFLISGVIFLVIVRGLLKNKHWALLLQVFLFLPLVGSFPIGTFLFLLIAYRLWKLEKSGHFS